MFRPDWMEALSKVYWWVPPLVYVPLIGALLAYAATIENIAALPILAWFAAGMLAWTPTEYVLHRWAFHYEPKGERSRRFHFIIHGLPHAYPHDEHRLVLPTSATLPLVLAFSGLFFSLFLAPGP